MIYRGGHSVRNICTGRRQKILIFLICLSSVIFLLYFIHRREPLEDFSGGLYPRTFATEYIPLQRELEFLRKDSVFQPEDKNAAFVPVVFRSWYTAGETSRIISGEQFDSPDYELLIETSLRSALKERDILFQEPLENPVPGDLFRCLEWQFERAVVRRDSLRARKVLSAMFCFSSVMLNSNAPDIYFLEKSVYCAKHYEKKFSGDPSALKHWEQIRAELSGMYVFPYRNLCRLDRLRSLRDFEKIRLNGIRLFDGKPVLGSQLKEAFYTGSFRLGWSAVKTKVIDFFYDVDRDQTLSLENYRKILHHGATPDTLESPDRKMSIRAMRRMRKNQEILDSALEYMEKGVE